MDDCESSPASSTPAAVDLFGLLPDDLVTDILSRIPTRQLWRCGTVCKRWHSLLGTPLFAQEHEKRHASSSVVTLVHRGLTDKSRFVFLKGSKYTLFRAVGLSRDAKKKMLSWPLSQLRASYHGLLLFRERHFDSTYCILNPLTREVVTFTSPGRVCGLYYYPPNRQYRLLCCRRVTAIGTGTGTSSSFLYYVCSTSHQELMKEVGTSDFVTEDDIPAVAAGSFLYLLAYKPIGPDRYIMTFDVMNETLQFMPHPLGHPKGLSMMELYEMRLFKKRLFEVANQLHLYAAGWQRIEVWALQDHKTWSWNKVFAIDRDEPASNWLPLTVEDGELLCLIPGRGIFRTNMYTERMELIGDTGGWEDRAVCKVNWRRSLV